jgi:hypothetical protein
VSEITLTNGMEGSYQVTNTGCGTLEITGHTASPHFLWSASPSVLAEGESATVSVIAQADIRLTSFTVVTDCRSQTHQWPDWP